MVGGEWHRGAGMLPKLSDNRTDRQTKHMSLITMNRTRIKQRVMMAKTADNEADDDDGENNEG